LDGSDLDRLRCAVVDQNQRDANAQTARPVASGPQETRRRASRDSRRLSPDGPHVTVTTHATNSTIYPSPYVVQRFNDSLSPMPTCQARFQFRGPHRTACQILSKLASNPDIAASGIIFGPSLNALCGAGCVSMNKPSAPAA